MARLRQLLAAPDEAQLAAATHQTPAQCLLAVQAFLWDRYREVRGGPCVRGMGGVGG